MRAPIRAALIAGGAAVALTLGAAGALAATGADDHPRVTQDDSVATSTSTSTPRPVPATTPPAAVVDDHGVDDPAAHDVGDDHGVDDPATHDVGDDHGGSRGSDD
ncbi:hypothetical protein ASF88_11975 [Leifsonia sp. Leaf336]|uniref:hypothetical protein n=1 Tax=Leifsonia sp. Leaf336 TaxID=1736341 RepID=UPI0006F82999|nr:hypothetical protein [Leifsonia sp. Leaf336]KQR52266.1 hypothetical protein ASF88_11975 [Leifsonia sp. Leaf336]